MVVSGLFHTIYWRLLIISYQCIYNVCLRIISYNFIIVLIWLNISHKIQSLKDGSRCSCVSFCCLQSIFWLLLRDWCVLNFPMFHSWIEPKSFLSKNKWGRPGLISLHPKFCLVFGKPTATNNGAESFHKQWKEDITKHRPNVWVFVLKLSNILKDKHLDSERLQIHDDFPQRKSSN